MIRKVSKQVVQRVSSLVARHELFERQGERPVQPPLPPDAWTGGSEAPSVEGPSNEDDDEPTCRVSDADDIVALLKSGPMVVNHWATWCESCMAEIDVVRQLADSIDVPLVGISWDSFEDGDLARSLQEVETVVREQAMTWPHHVVSGHPDDFFSALEVEPQQIPQTWIVGADGEVVHRIHGVIEAKELPKIVAQVKKASA